MPTPNKYVMCIKTPRILIFILFLHCAPVQFHIALFRLETHRSSDSRNVIYKDLTMFLYNLIALGWMVIVPMSLVSIGFYVLRHTVQTGTHCYNGGSSYEDRRAHVRRMFRSFGRDVRSLGARRDETLSLKYNVEKHLGKHIFVPLY